MNETYYVEIAEGGPWLAQDGSVAVDWETRGLWPSKEDAAEAFMKSLEEIKK